MRTYAVLVIMVIGYNTCLHASSSNWLQAKKVDKLITNMRGIVQSDANNQGYYAIGGIYGFYKDTLTIEDTFYLAKRGKGKKEAFLVVALVDSNGIIQWHKNVRHSSSSKKLELTDVTLSEKNSIGFSLNQDWHPNYALYLGNDTITYSSGWEKGIVICLDGQGNHLWDFSPEGKTSNAFTKHLRLTFDSDENLYLTGWCRDTIYFGKQKLYYDISKSSSWQWTTFLAKFSPKGRPVWQEVLGTTARSNIRSQEVEADKNSVYVLSRFSGSLTRDTTSFSLSSGSTPRSVPLVMRFDTAGAYKWYHYLGEQNYQNDLRTPTGSIDQTTGNYAYGFFNNDTLYTNKARTKYIQPVKFGLTVCIVDSNGARQSIDALEIALNYDQSVFSELQFNQEGHCIVTGNFSGSTKVGGKSHSTSGASDFDIFFAGTDSSGQFAWVETTGSKTGQDSALTMFRNPNGDYKLLSMFRSETILGKDTFNNKGKQEYVISDVIPYRFPPELRGKSVQYVYADSLLEYQLPYFSDYNAKLTFSGAPTGLNYVASSHRMTWPTKRSNLGTHKFKIYIKDRAGLDSMNFTIHVIDHLKASLNAPTQICLGASMEPTIDAPDAGKLSYTWLFGDKGFSYAAKVKHQYQDTGSFQLSVILENALGQRDTLDQMVVVNPVPKAAFVASHLCAFDSLQLVDTSHTNGASIAQRRWRMNGADLSTAADQFKYYVEAAKYETQLHISNVHNCSDSVTQTINVNKGLSLIANLDTQVCSSSPVNFKVQPIWFNDQVARVYWQFEDSLWAKNTSTSQLYQYERGGIYEPLITVEGVSGCFKTVIGSVEVFQNPTSIFASTKLCVGNPNKLLNESEDGDTNIVEYKWLINGLLESNKDDLPVQFNTEGQQKISLISTDLNGCSDTLTQNLRVSERPTVTFSVKDSCAGSEAIIKAKIDQQGRDSIISYKWGVNGNNLSEESELYYRYGDENKANVALVLGTKNGCIAVATRSINVVKPEPAMLSIENACFGDTIALNEQYNRDNLDSISYRSKAISILDFDLPLKAYFTETGLQDLTLITHSKQGCKDTFSKAIEIWEQPVASFTYSRKQGQQVYFSLTDSNEASYLWNVDGNEINENHFVYRFANAGTYPVTLTSMSDEGCANKQVREIEIYPLGMPGELKDGIEVLYQTGSLIVSSKEGPISVSLFGMDGKLLLSKEPLNRQHLLPINQFAAGIYLLTITDANYTATLKVLLP